MEEFSKIESLEYLVRNEIRISEWKEDAMCMTCRDIITLNANSNPDY